ncbi:MAG: hypothetical protein JRI30_06165 [Deltaproteobacteria bacterium]|nr:hypothetical protein [Deltaproteobacteria bacterium]
MKKIPTIGFISAPAWFDPAPSDLLPEFDYRLESVASVQNELNLCARSLKAIGCDVVAQVGSPFAWANATSEAEARLRNKAGNDHRADFGIYMKQQNDY